MSGDRRPFVPIINQRLSLARLGPSRTVKDADSARSDLISNFLSTPHIIPLRETYLLFESQRTSATVASTTFSNTLAQAQSQLQSLRHYLPSQLQSLIPQQKPTPTPSYLSSLIPASLGPYLSTELVLALVVPFVILLSMSGWRSYLPRYSSPYTGQHGSSRPTVTEDDYHYLGPDDIVDPPRARNDTHFSHLSRHTSRADDNPDVPDILVLKHRGTTYPLHFPAYSIGEGVLRVGQLRRYAADKTGTADPRRIKLLYKGKILKDDAVACREEGLKQNSELMCVVSEVPITNRRGGNSSESSADEEDLVAASREGPQIDVDGTIIDPGPKRRTGHRSGSKKAPRPLDRDDLRYSSSDHRTSATSAHSSVSHIPSTTYHASTPTSIPKEKDQDHSYRPQPPLFASEPKPAPAPERHTSPKPVQTGPKTPMEKLEDVASTFHTKFVPLCVQFTNNPPKDSKLREQEYMKLSESILAQIIFKLDEVDTEGNEDARSRRRALVKETQAVLSNLDAVQKGGK